MGDFGEGLKLAAVGFSTVLVVLGVLSILLWAVGVVVRRTSAGGKAASEEGKEDSGAPTGGNDTESR